MTAGATVKLPGVGPVSRRSLYIGGGLALAVVGVVWWRRRTAAAAAPAGDASTDDTGLVDEGFDAGGGAAGGGGGGSSTSPSTGVITSNPQWSQEVMQLLGGVIDPGLLSAALGLYLTGSAVNHDQELVIDQAIAAAGYPPVAGPSGYPPAIRTQPAGGQTPPTPAPDDGSVQGGRNVQGYFEAWNRHDPTLHLTYKKFLALNADKNPKANIDTHGNASGADDSFIHDATYRLR